MASKPTHEVFFVKDLGKDKKGFWTKIGAAWQHKETTGMQLKLDLLPTDLGAGDLVILEAKAEDEEKAA
ncbi:MAG: hypothetical protein AAGF25_00495 [Pseudomonadota bacterium]